MLDAVFHGLLLGMILSIMLGPVFFAHLQTVIYKGYITGFILFAGIVLSDITLILLAYFGFAQFLSRPQNGQIFGIIGGVLMIVIGFYTYRRKVRFRDMRPKEINIKKAGIFANVLKGFFLNFANPFVWIFWLGVVSVVTSASKGSKPYLIIFFVSLQSIYILGGILKTFLAYKVKRLLRPRTILLINRIVGVLMFLFGIFLIIEVTFIRKIFKLE